MRAFSSKGQVPGMKCLAVLGGDYKTGAMLFPKNWSSPWIGVQGTQKDENSLPPLLGDLLAPGSRALPSVWIRPDIAPTQGIMPGKYPTKGLLKGKRVWGGGREGRREVGWLCDVWAHDSIITQPQSLREPQLMTTRPLLKYKWCPGRLLKLLS